jgi:tetratricopeptide (TPR) repeat protein
LNNLAWVLATSPDDQLRNGQLALELATRACEVTEYQAAHILSTLAAAQAELGNFDKAIENSTQAVEKGSDEMKEQLQKELDSYQQNQPWREIQELEKKLEADISNEDGLLSE